MNVALHVAPSLADSLIQRAGKMIPSLRERAPRIATERRMPDDVLQELRDAGLMEVLRPRQFGGREMSPDVMFRVARELSKGDGSTAWVYTVVNSHDLFIGLYARNVQEEYWASARQLAASSFMPAGKTVPAPGGFRLSGRWLFCSGIDHCGWVILGGIPAMLEGPTRPDVQLFLVPACDYLIEDDWHAAGLSGTGSKSVILDNAFVPSERAVRIEDVEACRFPGAQTSDNPIYKQSIFTSINFFVTVTATGIARSAYEQLVGDLRRRAAQEAFADFRKPAVQMNLAEADALIECSDMLYMRSLDEHYANIAAGIIATDQQRVKYRRNQAYSALSARKGAEILLGLAGGRAVMEHHPVSRAVRDLYAVTAHARGNWNGAALSFGSVALGGGPLEQMI